jgi:hypothetical protein
MLTNYPTSIVVHGVALNITVQTYNESLEFGLMSCGDAMPDVAELALHVHEAFDEFQALPPSPAPVTAESPSKPAAPSKRTKGPPVAKATKRKRTTKG